VSTPTDVPTKEQLEADIAATREQLGQTVEQLGHKMDVKGRARDSVSSAAHRVGDRARTVGQRVGEQPGVPIGALVAVAVGLAVVLWRRRR
jgi:hypothetical protein